MKKMVHGSPLNPPFFYVDSIPYHFFHCVEPDTYNKRRIGSCGRSTKDDCAEEAQSSICPAGGRDA